MNGTTGLFFPFKKISIKGETYLQQLKEKLELHVTVHDCDMFMHDELPYHYSENGVTFFGPKKFKLLDWSGYSPDLNPIKNLWIVVKNKVAAK